MVPDRASADTDPTPAEWRVLRIVHAAGSCAAREVVAETSASLGWSASTTKTLLRRLVQKGQLRTKRVGNSFLYKPTRSAVKLLCRAADDLLANAVDGAVGPVLAHMVERSNLTRDELDELRRLIDRKVGEAPTGPAGDDPEAGR